MPARLHLPIALRLWALGAIAAASACSLTTSLSGLTGGEAVADAGGDAANDTSIADAIPPETTPGDAGVEAAKPFCLSLTAAPVFCQDFDEDALLSGWTAPELTPVDGGRISLDLAGSVSPPLSFLTTVNASDAVGVGESADVYRSFVQAATSEAHLSFDLRIDAFDPTTKADIVRLEFGPLPYDARYGLTLALSSGSAVLEQITPADDAGSRQFLDTSFATTPAMGKWTHVEQDITFGGAAPSTTVSLDGVPVLTQMLDSRYHSGPVTLFLGVTYTQSPSAKVSFRYDNVVLDFK